MHRQCIEQYMLKHLRVYDPWCIHTPHKHTCTPLLHSNGQEYFSPKRGSLCNFLKINARVSVAAKKNRLPEQKYQELSLILRIYSFGHLTQFRHATSFQYFLSYLLHMFIVSTIYNFIDMVSHSSKLTLSISVLTFK